MLNYSEEQGPGSALQVENGHDFSSGFCAFRHIIYIFWY